MTFWRVLAALNIFVIPVYGYRAVHILMEYDGVLAFLVALALAGMWLDTLSFALYGEFWLHRRKV